MRRSLFIVAAMIPIAGCNGSSPSGNSSSTTTTTTTTTVTAATLGIKPGKWEHSVEILDVQSPSMPPAVLAGMKARLGKATVATRCLTPEEAAKGASAFEASAAVMKNIACHFNKQEFAGGKISTEMVCTLPSGTMTVHSNGTYSATDYSVDGEVTQTGKADLTEKTRSTGHWVGECDAAK